MALRQARACKYSGGMSTGSPPSAPTSDDVARGVVWAGLGVALLAVSTSAILVRVADAPSMALAFWRTTLAALLLAPFAVRSGGLSRPSPAQRRQLVLSGAFLAAHFAFWITSLSFTSVASSVVLVTTSPLFVGAGAALVLREAPSRRTWAGIASAMLGAVIIAAGDLGFADLGARALIGDMLAFLGAAAVSGYLLIGRAARQTMPLPVYATWVYGVAGFLLLVACLVTRTPLGLGARTFDATTWLAIAGMVLGPQLLGHTVFNTLLSTVTATVVAVVTVAEPIGASLLAAVFLNEYPQPSFYVGGPPLLFGVWLAATAGTRSKERGPPGARAA